MAKKQVSQWDQVKLARWKDLQTKDAALTEDESEEALLLESDLVKAGVLPVRLGDR